jgi:hypothetical protein
MFGTLARLAGRLRRPRNMVIAVVLGLGGVAVPAVAFAPPALALNCTYDTFYAFQNVGEGGTIGPYESSVTSMAPADEVTDDANATYDFCQVNAGWGGQWYEWVLKGTSDCLTLYAADLNSEGVPAVNYIDVTGCEPSGVAIASQQWLLGDNLGGETWGSVESAWDSGTGWYLETYPHSPPFALTYNAPSLGAPLNSRDEWTLINEGS